MNKRIEQFPLESGAWRQVYDKKRFMVDSNFDIERFARLIVRECAGVAIDNGCGDFVDIKQKLFEHFGVEL
jgi:hypothetical protein